MSSDPSRRPFPGPSQQSQQDELRDAVRNVIEAKQQEATERKAARRATKQRAQRQTPLLVLLAAVTGTLAWAWTARPDAIFGGSQPAVALTPERAEARARYALFLERARVEAFRVDNGRYPAQLSEAGPVEQGVSYSLSRQGFVLELSVNGKVLRLDHAARADSFLGNSLDVLRRR